MKRPTRDYTIDWLRVLATLAVFIFHSGAAFAAGDWHLNNPVRSFPITVWNAWLLLWMMPLLFLLAGASATFSLRSRTPRRFAKERFARLLIPLLFGIFVIVPPQVYIERLSRGQFSGSYLAFYPNYFDGWYLAIGGPGNFAWMGLHLWFLLFLLLISLLALPIVRWTQQADATPFLEAGSRLLARPGLLVLLALPIAVVEWLWGNVGLGGWHMLTYPIFFLYGAFLYTLPSTPEILRRSTWPALAGALLTTGLLFSTVYANGMIAFGQHPYGWQRVLHAASGWFWVLALMGLAYRSLNFRNRFLTYANQAVLPFYILHQTVIILTGYAISQINLPLAAKYGFVLLFSLLGILVLYEGIVRRTPQLHYFFGMKG